MVIYSKIFCPWGLEIPLQMLNKNNYPIGKIVQSYFGNVVIISDKLYDENVAGILRVVVMFLCIVDGGGATHTFFEGMKM